MGAAIRHFTAIGPGEQVFTVNIERDFRYEPYRDSLICAHCDWSPSLLTTRRTDTMAWEHLADAHDAAGGRTDRENESFRKARWVMLPLCSVLIIALLVFLQS
ncbi:MULTISPECIES: hypothetical protein [unclassified Streptomyces]|uniref:hypothetical protein n=1 Tax=unclassified Streptomyces TaxID=2593676 RepID=UPI0004CA4407|nr:MULTISPECIES: hypothetical protein [unclassified Streptomyces]KPC81215.1 hypothetical protein ADK82_17575 [Streptomyces sp. NRRL S-4]